MSDDKDFPENLTAAQFLEANRVSVNWQEIIGPFEQMQDEGLIDAYGHMDEGDRYPFYVRLPEGEILRITHEAISRISLIWRKSAGVLNSFRELGRMASVDVPHDENE